MQTYGSLKFFLKITSGSFPFEFDLDCSIAFQILSCSEHFASTEYGNTFLALSDKIISSPVTDAGDEQTSRSSNPNVSLIFVATNFWNPRPLLFADRILIKSPD